MQPIAFSTLACGDWPIETVVAQAAAIGYDSIEWRGGAQGHVSPAMQPAARSTLRRISSESGVGMLAVTAYTSLVGDDPRERQDNLDDLRRYADLAADLGARYVRAFLGRLPPGVDMGQVYARAEAGLATIAEYAGSIGVAIAVEPHDDFVCSAFVTPLLERIRHPALGVIWDLGNTHAAGEGMTESVRLLGERICYIHVKDGRGRGPHWRLTPIGEGQVQLGRAFALLRAHGYRGPLSVEWERAWHPELDPPEIALPAALAVVRQLLANAHRHPFAA